MERHWNRPMYTATDQEMSPVPPDGRLGLPVALQEQECNAIQDQRHSHRNVIIQMGIQPIIQQHAQHASGNHRHNHMAPQVPGFPPLQPGLLGGEGVQLMEKQHNHRANGAQLNDHFKHGPKFIRHGQGNQLFQENQVARRADGQPLGNSLHNAVEDGFQNFQHSTTPYFHDCPGPDRREPGDYSLRSPFSWP